MGIWKRWNESRPRTSTITLTARREFGAGSVSCTGQLTVVEN
jgi:hypothetical protein